MPDVIFREGFGVFQRRRLYRGDRGVVLRLAEVHAEDRRHDERPPKWNFSGRVAEYGDQIKSGPAQFASPSI